jgi:hypothetical protein
VAAPSEREADVTVNSLGPVTKEKLMLVEILIVTIGVALGLLTASGGFARKWGRKSNRYLIAPKGAGFGVAGSLLEAENAARQVISSRIESLPLGARDESLDVAA